MKRVACLLLLTALTGTGCIALPGWKDTAPTAPQGPLPPPPAVLPDEVNDANAHDKARALLAEIDHDTANPPAAVVTPPKEH
jgi:hypothetical protein